MARLRIYTITKLSKLIMELKAHIQLCSTLMLTQLRLINTIEVYGDKEYHFLYGMSEKHTSIKRMFKEIKRILCLKM